MKRELVVQKKLLLTLGITYIVALLLPLSMFLMNTNGFTDRVIFETRAYYSLLYMLMTIIVVFIPVAVEKNDNRQFYLAIPKSRMKIMLSRYSFVVILGVIGFLLTYLYYHYIQFLFEGVGLVEEHSEEMISFIFNISEWFIFAIIVFKLVLTTTLGINLQKKNKTFFKMMIPSIGLVLFIVFLFELRTQVDLPSSSVLAFPVFRGLLIMIIVVSLVIDYLSYRFGEV